MTRKAKQDEPNRAIAKQIIAAYQPKTAEDMNDALKDIFGPMIEEMLKAELDYHLGYESNDKGAKSSENRRNGYGTKTVKTEQGETQIKVPRDRDGSFEPQVVQKRQNDISRIEQQVISMYAKGMSQRDISKVIEGIYGFSVSHEMISQITDRIMPMVEEWRNRPLNKCYAFLFVDCMYVKIRQDYQAKECAVYSILGYALDGSKELLGIWLSESESKNFWMQIFDEIKARGVEDVFFICMDGVSGLESGAKSIFPKVIVQRCIVHLIRNSLKYVPSKDYKSFTAALKKVYGAVNLQTARKAFEELKKNWDKYPGAIRVWEKNFSHVEQLFDYGSAVRRVMYTTNAIEAVNSSYRKVVKKGAFPNEEAVYKSLYLRAQELEEKWKNAKVKSWPTVLNQLMIDENFSARIEKYVQQ
jgi:transposase-like protein